jgi:anaphase-promoting complex subunit 4
MTTNDGTTSLSPSFFKQIHEKHTTNEVKLMLWNPKMDLVALAFNNGDVHLYRMSWQKVWSINSHQQNVDITSLAWRPDGKVLAVSYSNGHLRLLAVEDARKIFSFNCNESIQWLYWMQEDDELGSRHESHSFYEDISSRQLPKPISYDIISHLFEKSNNRDFPDNLFIKETKNLTFLICAHGTSIAIFVYGYFLLVDANLDIVPSFLNYKQLKACFLSDNTSVISTLGLTEENLLVYSLLDARIMQENHLQIKLISTKFGMLFSMLTAIKSVIKEMEEVWEDILVEMDQKFQLYALEKYNNTNGDNKQNDIETATINLDVPIPNNTNQQTTASDTSLVHDFMLLYSFGTCSDHFKNFLINELTEKGLKKLEVSVENYYSNIQRLLSGNFHQISLCMFYHLNELYGMTKWFDKFKIFSLTEQHVNDVLNCCASLILKAQELNFVIDQNMKEIKLFFKWLHASIIHLSDDQAATDMIRFNEEMENSILDFIQNTFKDAQQINLEKVGQYLKQESIRTNPTDDNNWQTFIKEKLTTPKETEFLYLTKRDKSLIGCFDEFKQSLNACFHRQAINSTQPFSVIKQYNIHKFNTLKEANEMLLSFKCFPTSMVTGLLMANTNNECYILKHPISSDPEVKAYIINLNSHTVDISQLSIQDSYIYNENNITLMGTDKKTSSHTYLIQLDLQTDSSDSKTSTDVIEVKHNSNDDKSSTNRDQTKNLLMIKAEKLNANAVVKYLKNTKSSSFCVSSSRKVAALVIHFFYFFCFCFNIYYIT